jgi:hypothetical protein
MATSPAAGSAQHDQVIPQERALRVALWGATGAAGGEVLRQCLAEPRIGDIVAFTRRPLSEPNPRVTQVEVDDFLDMTPHRRALRNIDVVYWCLGVSQLAEPSTQGYRVVTRDFAVAAAKVLREESPNAVFHFLSGMGAARNGFSPVMWGRVKGEAEKALAEVGLRRLVVWRPTFIHSVAKRERPTRSDRMAELLCFRAIPLLTNSTVNIAQAMLHATFSDEGDQTYGPWKINQLARGYRTEQEKVD